MNRNQKIILCMLLFSAFFICIPTCSALSGSIDIPYLQCAQLTLFGRHSTGSYSATFSISAFITNNSNHGCSSSGALWTHSGTSGSWDLDLPGSGPWYIVFVNVVASPSVQVNYEISGSPGIPSFDFLFTIYCILGLISILRMKRRFNF